MGELALMPGWRRWIVLGVLGSAAFQFVRPAHAGAEIKLGKDFLDGVVAKLPPTSFDKADNIEAWFTRIGSSRSIHARVDC
jgi:hypothetical protein